MQTSVVRRSSSCKMRRSIIHKRVSVGSSPGSVVRGPAGSRKPHLPGFWRGGGSCFGAGWR
eukprot:6406466-Lingulodinium_polyedra.AAC.1